MKKILLVTLLWGPLLLVAQTSKLPASLVWEKTFGGSKIDRANSVIPTNDHGFLVVGLSFSNDGQVTGHHGTTDSSDAWVVKLNSSGDMEWQKSLGGSNTDAFVHAVQAANGDFICVGTTRSVDGDVTGLHTSSKVASDVWAVRINRYGVIQWSKVFGGSEEDHGQVIRKMADGNYMIAGDALSNDFDVSGNHGGVDIWVLKMNDQGNLIWQQSYGNADHQYTSGLTVTSDNNYVISGYLTRSGLTDNPSNHLPYYNRYEEATAKIDGQGNVLWQRYDGFIPGNPGPSKFFSRVVELPSHQLYAVGNSLNASSTDVPSWLFRRIDNGTGGYISGSGATGGQFPTNGISMTSFGPEAVQLLSDSSILTCISALNLGATVNRISTSSNGNFYYQSSYGNGVFYGMIALTDDEYVAAGIKNNADFWIVKINSLNQIKGKAFTDNNGNGIKEAREPYFKNGFVESKKGGASLKSNIGTDGDFLNFADTGTYTSTVTVSGKPYYTVTPASKQSTFTSYKNKDSFSFAVVPIANQNDLQLSMYSLNAVRPGFDVTYKVNYSNVGTTTIGNTVIKLAKPSVAGFVSSTLTPATITADTITWNIGSMAPFDAADLYLVLKIGTPPAVNMGDVLELSATINPVTGDVAPADNTSKVRTTVIGSYDPNDKTDNTNGSFYLDQLQGGEALTYTIRFQNVGTDTAFNIVVRDTLSDQLDMASLELISASHLNSFSIKDNKYCTWTFNNILLPDKNTNEPASHGYITYRIKPKATLQSGDAIYNSASIYFDFNLPVQTNRTATIIKPTPPPPPAQPLIGGVQMNYCGSQGTQKFKIFNLPATSGGITATVKLDATVLTVARDSTVSFNIATLTGGSHSINVAFSNGAETKTTTATFTVMVAATPDVNVSANITNVTNLANPVVVTAANAKGGGKNPLYTFAWNNSFTNIIQVESSNNILNITPSGLALGDNKVFVKMKTSEDCYTVQTSIDSIIIRRDQATGIIDAEYPSQVINIYPNPFTGPITINGLSSAKVYDFRVINLQGQVVYSKQVTNQSSVAFEPLKAGSGTYWITIYDVKRKRLLGSVKLIKK